MANQSMKRIFNHLDYSVSSLRKQELCKGFLYNVLTRCQSQWSNVTPKLDYFTHKQVVASQLKRCSELKELESVYATMLKSNAHQDCFLMNQFVSVCSTLGGMDSAILAFAHMEVPNVFVYNAMIRGFFRCASSVQALEFYLLMLRAGVSPTSFTFPCLIKACSQVCALGFGEAVHGHIWKNGFESHVFVQTALIDFYSIMGKPLESRRVFDEMPERDAFAWTTMISGHVRVGDLGSAEKLFNRMPEKNTASWNTMIAGYARLAKIESAAVLFNQMPVRDLVTWTTMISCYSQNKQFQEALGAFQEMKNAGVRPDEVTMSTVISACAHLEALDLGREIHLYVIQNDFSLDVYIGSALIDMYAKCGNLDRSLLVFFKLKEKNLFCWNSVIEGLASHGYAKEALAMFSCMEGEKILPNGVTFISVLSACTHGGLVEEGRHRFLSMTRDYSISPEIEHYGCMVDLLCRAGLLDEALGLVRGMTIEPNAVVWGAILGGCKLHGSLEIAEVAVDKLMVLEPDNSGYYVLLINMYAEANQWNEVAKVRAIMKERGVTKKSPGSSWIEMEGRVHEFVASDKSHPISDYSLSSLRKQESCQGFLYNVLTRCQSQWSKVGNSANDDLTEGKHASRITSRPQMNEQINSDSELAKYSSDEDDLSDHKWGSELAWLTKALEPALQLYRWALPTGNGNEQKSPPATRSVSEIIASIQRSKAGIQDWSLGDLTIGLYLIYLRQAASNQVEDVNGIQISSDAIVQDLIYHTELAKGCYKDSATGLARNSMLRERNIVKFVKNSSVLRPGYYIGIDIRNKLVIFGIRGTHTVYDLITNIASSSDQEVTFEGYSSHFGTAEAARWFLHHEIETIRKCLKKHEGFRLRLVGHSLGGAAASLFAIMLRKKSLEELGFSPDIVSAVGFATPPCVSKELAESCSSYISTVVLQPLCNQRYGCVHYPSPDPANSGSLVHWDDIVPRLSVASLIRLRNEILQTDWMSTLEKEDWKGVVDLVANAKQVVSSVQDVARKFTDYAKFTGKTNASDVSIREKSVPVAEVPHSSKTLVNSGAAAVKEDRSSMPEELFVPGTLYYLKRKVDADNGRISSKGRESYTLWKRHPGEHFQRIVLSSNLISDHKCDSHYYALRDVLKGLPLSDHERFDT